VATASNSAPLSVTMETLEMPMDATLSVRLNPDTYALTVALKAQIHVCRSVVTADGLGERNAMMEGLVKGAKSAKFKRDGYAKEGPQEMLTFVGFISDQLSEV